VRELYEKALARSLHAAEAKVLGPIVGASVSGEHHGPRNRLIREQPVHAEIVARESEGTRVGASRLPPDDVVMRAGIVVERRLLLGVVLADEAEEHRTRDLILDLEPRDLPDADRA